MPDYQNSKIYSIRSYQSDDIYIGSTTETLCRRLAKHNAQFKLYKINKARYMTSFKLLEYDDHYIELIMNYPCNSKEELHKKEGEIIRKSKNCVNKYIPARTDKEYYEDNKEKIKEKIKEYYEANKESITEKIKKYREENIDKIKANSEERILCNVCDCLIRRDYISHHKKTKKHLSKVI